MVKEANGIRYKDIKVYKYMVTTPYSIYLKELDYLDGIGEQDSYEGNKYTFLATGDLIIHKGYKSDGPSGVTLDTKSFMRGAFVHDVLYEAMREGLLPQSFRKAADKILYRLCREDGMTWVRAQYVYRAVRVGGKKSASPGYTL